MRDNGNTYSSTRLSRGTRVSREADGALQTQEEKNESLLSTSTLAADSSDSVTTHFTRDSSNNAPVTTVWADVQGFPWGRRHQRVRGHRRVQQLRVGQSLLSLQILLLDPREKQRGFFYHRDHTGPNRAAGDWSSMRPSSQSEASEFKSLPPFILNSHFKAVIRVNRLIIALSSCAQEEEGAMTQQRSHNYSLASLAGPLEQSARL